MGKQKESAAAEAAPKSDQQQREEWSLFRYLANCHLTLVGHLSNARVGGATIHHDDLGKL